MFLGTLLAASVSSPISRGASFKFHVDSVLELIGLMLHSVSVRVLVNFALARWRETYQHVVGADPHLQTQLEMELIGSGAYALLGPPVI